MRLRTTFIAAALTAGLIGFGASAASATDDDYVPGTHTVPSLDGSTASSLCVGDVPWIGYSVKLTDPDGIATSDIAYLHMTDGVHETDIKLGKLKKGALSGTILWPGATVDASGNPTGWPGWAFVDGKWEQTDGNFAWTRENITATIHVNPEIEVPLSYPAATEACASPTVVLSEQPAGLAATGAAVPYVAAAAGLGALALGAGLIARRRRATR